MDLSETNGLATYVVMHRVKWWGNTPLSTLMDACGPIERLETNRGRGRSVKPCMYNQRRVFDWLYRQNVPHHFTVIDVLDGKVRYFVCLLCIDPQHTVMMRILFGVLPATLQPNVFPEMWEPNA